MQQRGDPSHAGIHRMQRGDPSRSILFLAIHRMQASIACRHAAVWRGAGVAAAWINSAARRRGAVATRGVGGVVCWTYHEG
jgi:hypothetical protein